MQNNQESAAELVRLSQIEYEADPAQPDLLGWPVVDSQGDQIGVLDDMLVDTETGEIPFASVCHGDKCTAVPLELFYLDEQAKRLVLPVEQEDLTRAPQFSDETEDIQPHIDYWNQVEANWEAEDTVEGEAVEESSGNNRTQHS